MTKYDDKNLYGSPKPKKDSSSMVVISCPRCNQKLRVPGYKRIEVKCSKCNNVFRCDNGITCNSERRGNFQKERNLQMLKIAFSGATLLSIDEVKNIPEDILSIGHWWWLRSRGYFAVDAAGVAAHGNVNERGYEVDFNDGGVRPALRLDQEISVRISDGTKLVVGEYWFTIVCGGKYALSDTSIGDYAFRNDWEAEDSNIYEASDVKKTVDKWFDVKVKNQPVFRCDNLSESERGSLKNSKEAQHYTLNDYTTNIKSVNGLVKRKSASKLPLIFDFIKTTTNTELIMFIYSEYKIIKNTFPHDPYTGENGSIEFSCALLLWYVLRQRLKSNPERYGPMMIEMADMFGCYFNCMSPSEWSDKMDDIIKRHKYNISYNDWNNFYVYLKNNVADQIRKLPFCYGSRTQEVITIEYMKFMKLYNSISTFAEMLEYYERQGLGMSKFMPFNVGD